MRHSERDSSLAEFQDAGSRTTHRYGQRATPLDASARTNRRERLLETLHAVVSPCVDSSERTKWSDTAEYIFNKTRLLDLVNKGSGKCKGHGHGAKLVSLLKKINGNAAATILPSADTTQRQAKRRLQNA